jgi:hypothetical protein
VGDGRDACAGASPLGSFVFKFGVVCLLGFATLNAEMVWQVRESIAEGYGDFASFYTAGQIVRSGQSARLYDSVLQWKIQQHFASKVTIRLGPFPYVRPPFEALLFLPLAHLSYPAACALWMGLQIILLLMAPLLLLPVLGRTFDLHAYAVQALVCLAFCPVGFSLVQGQDSVVLLLILIVALGFLLRGADYSCGAVLGLGLFKFHLVIPLFAILMLRKKWRAGVGFVAVAAVLVAISLIMVGWSGLLTYPKYLWGLNQAPGLGMVKPQSMPNVRGLLTVLLGNAALPVWANLFLAAIVVAGVIREPIMARSGSDLDHGWILFVDRYNAGDQLLCQQLRSDPIAYTFVAGGADVLAGPGIFRLATSCLSGNSGPVAVYAIAMVSDSARGAVPVGGAFSAGAGRVDGGR